MPSNRPALTCSRATPVLLRTVSTAPHYSRVSFLLRYLCPQTAPHSRTAPALRCSAIALPEISRTTPAPNPNAANLITISALLPHEPAFASSQCTNPAPHPNKNASNILLSPSRTTAYENPALPCLLLPTPALEIPRAAQLAHISRTTPAVIPQISGRSSALQPAPPPPASPNAFCSTPESRIAPAQEIDCRGGREWCGSGAGAVRERCGSGAGVVREWCGRSTGVAREWCGSGAGVMRGWCVRSTGVVREWCGSGAVVVRECVHHEVAPCCSTLNPDRRRARVTRRRSAR